MPITIDIQRLWDQKYRDESAPFLIDSGGAEYGAISTLPDADGTPDGTLFVATDVGGGTIYQLQNGAWTQVTRGVTATVTATTATSTPKLSLTTTRQALPSAAAITVFLKADAANTGMIYVGDNTVTSSGGGNVFAQLSKAEGVTIDAANANQFNAVASTGTQILYVGVVA